jgi:hypothetical protein
MLGKAIIGAVAVALDRAAKVDRDKFIQTLGFTSRVPFKNNVLPWFGGDGVVLGLDFDSEPIKGLREATGTELQAKTIAKNSAGFAHGKPFGLVEIGSQSEGAGSELDTGAPMAPDICKGCLDRTL